MADITAKIQNLSAQLKTKCAREFRLAEWSHWLNVAAMALTIITAGVAVGYGMIPGHLSQVTAALALVPGGIAVFATSLKLEKRCNWHYKRFYALSALIRTLEFELPETPTQDDIKDISAALSKLEIDMEALWEQDVSLDWNEFKKK